MSLPPDVLTDLVILYHAGEASEASRALLEEEATRNPRVAAALQAKPRAVSPLPVDPPDVHRRAIKEIHGAFRLRLIFSVVAVSLVLLFLATVQRPAGSGFPWIPVLILGLVFTGMLAAARWHHRRGPGRL